MIGQGRAARVVEEWGEDAALLAELRALEALTAKELGQHVTKAEVTGKDGEPFVTNAEQIAMAALDRLRKEATNSEP